jgi:hypothetical protein
MLLDTAYSAEAGDGTTAPTLTQLRDSLTSAYPQVGPIFA